MPTATSLVVQSRAREKGKTEPASGRRFCEVGSTAEGQPPTGMSLQGFVDRDNYPCEAIPVGVPVQNYVPCAVVRDIGETHQSLQ